MKKFYFTSGLFFHLFTGFGQTEKGNWLLGGNISFTSASTTENGNSSSGTLFSLNPKIGVFVVNNFTVILNTEYASTSSGGFSDHSLLIGPALRYYFPGSESVKFFAGAGIGFGTATSVTSTAYQFEAGPAFFIRPSVALELNINYQIQDYKSSGAYSNTMKVSQFGIGVGFMIYLGKQKKNA